MTILRLHCHYITQFGVTNDKLFEFNIIYSGSVRRVRLCRMRVRFCRLKAIFSRAHFRYRTQGRGSSLARDNPFLLSAIIIAFAVKAPGILRAKDRVKIIRADHVVPKIDTHPRVGCVRNRCGMNGSRRQRYPRVGIVTLAVQPLGQLSFGQPTRSNGICFGTVIAIP